MGFWAKEARQAYYQKNKSSIKKRSAEYKLQHIARYKELYKLQSLKKLYGLDQEAYNALLKAADYRCEICGDPTDLCVDHDHTTRRVRGILCRCCNVGLGGFRESKASLIRALSYLEKI